MKLGKGIWQQLNELPKYKASTEAFGKVFRDALEDLAKKLGLPKSQGIKEAKPPVTRYVIMTEEEKANLKEGDKIAIGTSWGIHEGIYPDLLGMDTHVNLWGGDTIKSKTACADLYKINKDYGKK